MEVSRSGNILLCFKGDTKFIYEYRSGKEVKVHPVDGQKKIVREFKNNYLIVVTFEKRNEKNEKSYDKYFVQILDTVNQYIAFFEAYSKVEAVLTNDQTIALVVCNQKSERVVLSLLEKDNSFKIETFFKRSFYNEAWRFAKNQNCQESLLAEISRLHGDLLYSKSDFSGAIKQYTLTLGFV
jgi:RecJ-like exonuclease